MNLPTDSHIQMIVVTMAMRTSAFAINPTIGRIIQVWTSKAMGRAEIGIDGQTGLHGINSKLVGQDTKLYSTLSHGAGNSGKGNSQV
jgi:hypothetical protein